MRRIGAPLLVATFATLTGAAAGADSTNVVVPLTVEHSPYHQPYLGIDVTIGSVTKRLEVDTGSPGLRILASALPADAFAKTGFTETGDFGNGYTLRGSIATASLAVAGIRSEHPVRVEAIESIACASWSPRCSAAKGGTPDEFGRVFPGVFGLRITNALPEECCVNPLLGLTGHVGESYIVHAAFAKPSLTLNPDAATVAKFASFPTTLTSWPEGCITVKDVNLRVCGEVMVDTGLQETLIQDPSPSFQGIFPGNTVASLSIGSYKHDFTSGGEGDERYSIFSQKGDRKRIIFGLGALQDVDVYFDVVHGRIGFLNR
jgi:hypothetical protein